MKVMLINPPKKNELSGSVPIVIKEGRGVNPPLGLLYLAAYLEKFSKHEVSVIDAQVEDFDYFELGQKLKESGPDVVGITVMTMTLLDVIKTVDIVKETCRAKIVLGGPHVHLYPTETITIRGVDFVVQGEGEEVLKELLDNMENKERLSRIPGLVFKIDGKIVNTGMRQPIQDIDSLPFPSRHLVPCQKYTSLLSKGAIVTTVITSRGCPYRCSFCDRIHQGKKFRARSPHNVIAEIEECVKMGIRDFLFYDDTFTIDKQRVIKICDEIIKLRLKIRWDIRARVDTVDEEMIASLQKAGCQGIHYGVESGSQRILNILNKGITLDQVCKAFVLTKKYKIPTLAYFMIGNPTETREDILQTFRFIKIIDPEYIHLTVFSPFPGTKSYLKGLREGKIKKDYWLEFASHPVDNFKLPYWEELLTRKELEALLIRGYKDFYLRYSYIVRNLLRLRSFSELRKKAAAALKIVHHKV